MEQDERSDRYVEPSISEGELFDVHQFQRSGVP